MARGDKRSKTTLDKLAAISQQEFWHIKNNMAIKDDLRHFATKVDLEDLKTELKDDIQRGTIEVLRAVDKIVTKFDKTEKEDAAHIHLHKRITDEFHSQDQRIKKVEAKV